VDISIAPLGGIRPLSVAECDLCCYNDYPSNQPYINGTHMLNGTDVIPVHSTTFGYMFNNSLILPCAGTFHVEKLYYRSNAKKNVPKLGIFFISCYYF
jgi:hypothetical protein